MEVYCEDCGTYFEAEDTIASCPTCSGRRIKKADFSHNEPTVEIAYRDRNEVQLYDESINQEYELQPFQIAQEKTKISEKELIPLLEQISIPSSISFEEVKGVIIDCAKNVSIGIGNSILYGNGEVWSDGLFGRKIMDCLILQNVQHRREYYGYCITKVSNYGTTVFGIYNFGTSKQMGKEEYLNNTRAFTGNGARSAVAGAFRGGAVGAGFAVGGMIGGAIGGSARLIKKGLAAMTMNKAALEEEKSWYGLMNMVLQQAFFGE